jgi:hypothetical protein
MSPTFRKLEQGCDLVRRLRRCQLSEPGAPSAAAIHITRRYASTTATDATSEADVPPNADPSAITATRPPSRAAALFTIPDAEPPRSQGAAPKTIVVSGAMHAVLRFGSTQGQVGAHDTEHNNVALADYLAAH